MTNSYNADLMKYRAQLIINPRPTGHPGSKKGTAPNPQRKTSAFKAASRPMRRYPGWKKRIRQRMQDEQEQLKAAEDARTQARIRHEIDREQESMRRDAPWKLAEG